MSRCDQLIGLNDYARELLACDPPVSSDSVGVVEGAWDTCVTDLSRYTLASGRVVVEVMQEAPWAGGPCYFLALQDEAGFWIAPTTWTAADIEAELGYSGEWTAKIARDLAIANLQREAGKLQMAAAMEDPIALTCAERAVAEALQAVRYEIDDDAAFEQELASS